jgi:hypothetical protein
VIELLGWWCVWMGSLILLISVIAWAYSVPPEDVAE